jgi:uncharacterized membrane protein YadS
LALVALYRLEMAVQVDQAAHQRRAVQVAQLHQVDKVMRAHHQARLMVHQAAVAVQEQRVQMLQLILVALVEMVYPILIRDHQ